MVAEHERQMTAPAGDVIRKFLPKDKPLPHPDRRADELRQPQPQERHGGPALQLPAQSVRGSARAEERRPGRFRPRLRTGDDADDQSDYERFKKLLDRLGKPVIMSADAETSEIIRRRLFDWDGVLRRRRARGPSPPTPIGWSSIGSRCRTGSR